jgi:hypothetical protein
MNNISSYFEQAELALAAYSGLETEMTDDFTVFFAAHSSGTNKSGVTNQGMPQIDVFFICSSAH